MMRYFAFIYLFLLVFTRTVPAISSPLPFSKPVDYFPGDQYKGNKRVWDVELNDTGLTFVAASEQLCIFDGMEWESYQANGCIRDLYFDSSSGRMYTAGDNFFGYYEIDDCNLPVFNLLYHNEDNTQFQNFWKIIPKNDILYIQTHEDVYSYRLTDGSLKKCLSSKEGNIGYIFDVGDRICGQSDNELFTISDDTVNFLGLIEKDRIVAVRFSGREIEYISEFGGIRKFANGVSVDVFPELNKRLSQLRVFSAIIMENGNYLLGTVLDGVFIIGNNGEIIEHINDTSGLRHSTVLSLEEDGYGNYWFGLDGGLVKFSSNTSTMFYTSRNQNIGDVYSSTICGDILVLGTNKGLYWVDSESNSHQVPGIQGIVWTVIDCGEFLAIVLDDDLYSLYPNGQTEKILSNVWRLSKWNGLKDLYYCSDKEGIVLLEKKEGRLQIRNRLQSDEDYFRVPLKHDSMGDLWVEGLWGGVQRIILDKEKKKVIKSRFYTVGDGKSMALSHSVDNQLVFSQGKDCYVYDKDKDSIVKSQYYSDICNYFSKGVFSFMQKDNLYFNYCDGEFGIVSRDADTLSFLSNSCFRQETYEYSDNYSKFTELNDSLIAIGFHNGIAIFNSRVATPADFSNLSVYQCSYQAEGKDYHLKTRNADILQFPYNANAIRIKMLGCSNPMRPVFYRLDDGERRLLQNCSSVVLPYLSSGYHKLVFTDGGGNTLYAIDLKRNRHWAYSWWFILLILILFSSVLVCLASYYTHRTEVLKRKYAIKQHEMMEQQRIKFENAKLSMELKERNARLTSIAINDITVNNMLKDIENALNKASSQSAEIKTAMLPVGRLIDTYYRTNGSWEAFEAYFNGIYDGFFDRLKAAYPQLSQNEIKICSYIRLGMTTKEIASLMNIEVISAESARHRLRKNMGLARTESLTETIARI